MPPKALKKVQNANGVPKQEKSGWTTVSQLFTNKDLRTSAFLTALAAIYSPVSLTSLSPVYGSVPSGLFHRHGTMAFALLALIARHRYSHYFTKDLSQFVPVLAFWIPTLQYFLFKQSSILGNPYGPLITEALTYFPLVALTIYSSAAFLGKVDFSTYGKAFSEHFPVIGTYCLFTAVEKIAKALIGMKIGSNFMLSRVGLQLTLAALYGLVLPSAFIWPAIPSVAFTMMYNLHSPLPKTTNLLNETLGMYNYTLVDRKESFTGYISVLENTQQHFRVLRCDHSLLGGQWMTALHSSTPWVHEPIYAIFAMLEAVRLVEPDDGGSRRADSESTALTIGLGIGTTPGALIAHGIPTTIVEIDPVVYDFAKKYFSLPSNHTPVITDAKKFVDDTQRAGNTTYDYIVHDVFTGGAEPVDLFTLDFMRGLHSLLKEEGVIAINYAGDIATSSARMIIYTIRSVFPTCRVFRENPPPESWSLEPDFTNMVIFCKKTKSPLTFRQPDVADFLHSRARQVFLYPQFEIPESVLQIDGTSEEIEKLVLKKGQTKQLEILQTESAVGHWALMRTVIPKEIWENW